MLFYILKLCTLYLNNLDPYIVWKITKFQEEQNRHEFINDASFHRCYFYMFSYFMFFNTDKMSIPIFLPEWIWGCAPCLLNFLLFKNFSTKIFIIFCQVMMIKTWQISYFQLLNLYLWPAFFHLLFSLAIKEIYCSLRHTKSLCMIRPLLMGPAC